MITGSEQLLTRTDPRHLNPTATWKTPLFKALEESRDPLLDIFPPRPAAKYPVACSSQDIEVPTKAQSKSLVEAGHCTAGANKQTIPFHRTQSFLLKFFCRKTTRYPCSLKQETGVSKPNPAAANQQLRHKAANQNVKNPTLVQIESSVNERRCGREDSVWGPIHVPLQAIYLQHTAVRVKH